MLLCEFGFKRQAERLVCASGTDLPESLALVTYETHRRMARLLCKWPDSLTISNVCIYGTTCGNHKMPDSYGELRVSRRPVVSDFLSECNLQPYM
jgi:hypothetical protein